MTLNSYVRFFCIHTWKQIASNCEISKLGFNLASFSVHFACPAFLLLRFNVGPVSL